MEVRTRFFAFGRQKRFAVCIKKHFNRVFLIIEAVKKELKKLEGLKAEQKIAEAEYEIQKEKLETLQENVRKLQQEVQTKRVEVEAAEADVRSVRKENAGIDKQLSSVEKSLLQHQQIESVRAAKRHSLLHECKNTRRDVKIK